MKTTTANEFSQDGLRFYLNTTEEVARYLGKSAKSLVLIKDRAYMDGMETPFMDLGPERRAVFVSETDYNRLPNPCYL